MQWEAFCKDIMKMCRWNYLYFDWKSSKVYSGRQDWHMIEFGHSKVSVINELTSANERHFVWIIKKENDDQRFSELHSERPDALQNRS